MVNLALKTLKTCKILLKRKIITIPIMKIFVASQSAGNQKDLTMSLHTPSLPFPSSHTTPDLAPLTTARQETTGKFQQASLVPSRPVTLDPSRQNYSTERTGGPEQAPATPSIIAIVFQSARSGNWCTRPCGVLIESGYHNDA